MLIFLYQANTKEKKRGFLKLWQNFVIFLSKQQA
jgi:hypothetical protein